MNDMIEEAQWRVIVLRGVLIERFPQTSSYELLEVALGTNRVALRQFVEGDGDPTKAKGILRRIELLLPEWDGSTVEIRRLDKADIVRMLETPW